MLATVNGPLGFAGHSEAQPRTRSASTGQLCTHSGSDTLICSLRPMASLRRRDQYEQHFGPHRGGKQPWPEPGRHEAGHWPNGHCTAAASAAAMPADDCVAEKRDRSRAPSWKRPLRRRQIRSSHTRCCSPRLRTKCATTRPPAPPHSSSASAPSLVIRSSSSRSFRPSFRRRRRPRHAGGEEVAAATAYICARRKTTNSTRRTQRGPKIGGRLEIRQCVRLAHSAAIILAQAADSSQNWWPQPDNGCCTRTPTAPRIYTMRWRTQNT